MKKQIFTIIVLIFVITTCVTGSVPKTLSYQGVVTDTNGNPKKDGEYKFTFSIYDDSVSGESLWSEEKTIQTKQGLFSTELGSVNPLNLSFDTRYWLQVEADGTVFPQRTKLTGAPYSFWADTAEVAKKADTAEILRGLVDNYYSRKQLQTSGDAKVNAGNIVNAEWLDGNPFNQDLNTTDSVAFRFIHSNNSTGIDIDDVTADTDSESTTNWNVVSQIKLTAYNNTMAFFTGYPQNQRKSFIQVGHRSSGYAKNVGELKLNPFGGSVTINGNIAWHKGNFDPDKYALSSHKHSASDITSGTLPNSRLSFDPDCFVQGSGSNRSVRYDEDYQLDDNIFSTFLQLATTDPNCPSENGLYGFRAVHPSLNTQTIEIVGRAYTGELYFGGIHGDNRMSWREIWHSGNFTPETQSSDIRFKTDIDSIKDPLKKVISLKGISFNWKHSDFPDRHFPEGRQIGVIAQEVEKILPEVIRTDKDGYKSVAYDKLSAILIEAVKQQQSFIDSLKNDLVKTKKDLESNNIELINFKNRLSKIENLIYSNDGE